MATVAPAAEAATSALKVITEAVMIARLNLRMSTLLPSVADTNSDDGRRHRSGGRCLQIHPAQV